MDSICLTSQPHNWEMMSQMVYTKMNCNFFCFGGGLFVLCFVFVCFLGGATFFLIPVFIGLYILLEMKHKLLFNKLNRHFYFQPHNAHSPAAPPM